MKDREYLLILVIFFLSKVRLLCKDPLNHMYIHIWCFLKEFWCIARLCFNPAVFIGIFHLRTKHRLMETLEILNKLSDIAKNKFFFSSRKVEKLPHFRTEQNFRSLKIELLENCSQGEDLQKSLLYFLHVYKEPHLLGGLSPLFDAIFCVPRSFTRSYLLKQQRINGRHN